MKLEFRSLDNGTCFSTECHILKKLKGIFPKHADSSAVTLFSLTSISPESESETICSSYSGVNQGQISNITLSFNDHLHLQNSIAFSKCGSMCFSGLRQCSDATDWLNAKGLGKATEYCIWVSVCN